MSKSDKFEYDLLVHVFNATAITNLNATGGSTDLWLSLHTADPTDVGSTAAEGGYTQYTRVSVDRGGFTVTSGTGAGVATATPTTAVDFPQETAGTTTTGTFTHFGVNPTSNSTANDVFYVGTLSPNINFGEGVTPRITTASSITED